jgi:hypothetical protein
MIILVNQARCIYCNCEGPFSEEHTVPRGLGEFKDSPKLNNHVCKKCNGIVGKLEDQFCHCGPEGYIRKAEGISGRPSHKEVNIFQRGSAGGKAIDMVSLYPELGIPILWQINGVNSVNEVKQILLIPENGEPYCLRIQDWMKEPKDLHKAILDLNLGKIKEARIWAPPEEMEQIEKLVSPLGEGFRWLPESPPGTIKKSVIKFTVTEPYFRAIAKIAFHYFLAITPSLSGHELFFQNIKNYIYAGKGRKEEFIKEEKGPILGVPENCTLNVYCHIIVVAWENGNIQARMQFFYGRGFNPPVYRIRIAEKADDFAKYGHKGHGFIYFPDGQEGKFCGEASELNWINYHESGNDA